MGAVQECMGFPAHSVVQTGCATRSVYPLNLLVGVM